MLFQYMTDIIYIHKIKLKEEELVLTSDDQLFFEMILLKIRGSCISYASFKKKEETSLTPYRWPNLLTSRSVITQILW